MSNFRERPANIVLKDVEKRLEEIERRESESRLPSMTLDLCSIEDGKPEALSRAATSLLNPKSFKEAFEIFDSLKRSAALTEKKHAEFEEKRAQKGSTLSTKEVGWGELMQAEKARKDDLLEKVGQHFWKAPKRVAHELIQAMSVELDSQVRMRAAYERKIVEGKERLESGRKTLLEQKALLGLLGSSIVKEYASPDGRTWVVKTSELKRENEQRNKEIAEIAL